MNRSQEIIKNHLIFKQICRYYGAARVETHYDVLGISKDASKQDIRLAYLKLSKEKHPDKNASDESHADFVKINEAYNILSKNDLREQYDGKLRSGYSHSYASSRSRRSHVYGPEEYEMYNTYYNVTMNINRKNARYRNANNQRKFSIGQMVFLCLMIWMFGNIFYVWAVMKSLTFNRKLLFERSHRFGIEEEKVRIKARENMQLYDNNAAIALALMQLEKDDLEDDDKKI